MKARPWCAKRCGPAARTWLLVQVPNAGCARELAAIAPCAWCEKAPKGLACVLVEPRSCGSVRVPVVAMTAVAMKGIALVFLGPVCVRARWHSCCVAAVRGHRRQRRRAVQWLLGTQYLENIDQGINILFIWRN